MILPSIARLRTKFDMMNRARVKPVNSILYECGRCVGYSTIATIAKDDDDEQDLNLHIVTLGEQNHF